MLFVMYCKKSSSMFDAFFVPIYIVEKREEERVREKEEERFREDIQRTVGSTIGRE